MYKEIPIKISGKNKSIIIKINIFLIFAVLIVLQTLETTKQKAHTKIRNITLTDNPLSSKLIRRIPFPAGQFSIKLPLADKSRADKEGNIIILTLSSKMRGSALGVSVEINKNSYQVITPSRIEFRKKVFLKQIKNNNFILKDKYSTNKLVSFEAITSNGLSGYEARLKGENSDKFYIEVYKDNRRLVFEIALDKGKLTKTHRNLLYAIVT